MPLSWVTGADNDPTRFTFCLFTNLTGHSCYGCGMTRAVFNVMHGQFVDAWHYNRLIVIVFPVLAGLWIRWIIRLWRQIRTAGK